MHHPVTDRLAIWFSHLIRMQVLMAWKLMAYVGSTVILLGSAFSPDRLETLCSQTYIDVNWACPNQHLITHTFRKPSYWQSDVWLSGLNAELKGYSVLRTTSSTVFDSKKAWACYSCLHYLFLLIKGTHFGSTHVMNITFPSWMLVID